MDSPDTVMNEAAAPSRSGGSRRSSRQEGDLSERARDDLLRRVPPHSEEAEQAVLSGVFLRPDLLQEIVDQLRDTDFYIPAHRIIFGAFMALFEQNTPVDEVTVFDWLVNHSQLEAAGGAAYLGDLSRAVVSGANAVHWAKIVRDKAMQRTLIETSAQIISNCYDATKDVPTLLDESERAIFSISERANSKTFSSSSELVRSVFDELLARYNNKSVTTGVPTGYMQLDKMTAGLQPTDLIMFIHREDAYNKKGDRPKTGIAEIIIGKHRNGPTGTVELAYRPEFTAFDDLETTYIEPSESQQG